MKKVLIVEDERDLLDSLREFFEDEGYAVTTAANGADALDLMAQGEAPSVVVLDLIMPVLDGNEVFSQMRREPRLSSIPVIVSTSDPARAPSGVVTLKKPFDLKSLLDAVERSCAGV